VKLELWQALVLGVVEGVTEYLPISSTGHLILAKSLMGLDNDPGMRQSTNDFAIIVQGGAILAVVGLYWPRCVQMVRGVLGRDPAGLRLLINLVVAFVPSAVVGLVLDKWIERHLFGVGPVLVALLGGALYMFFLERWRRGQFGLAPFHAAAPEITEITLLQAFKVGLLQCVALWPGTSRSMMTIAGGLLCGLRPRQAAEFSFLLGLPTLLAATLYKLAKNLYVSRRDGVPNVFEQLGVTAAVVGLVAAAVSAALAVKWLVGFLNRRGLTPFAWYRVALCVVLGVLAWRGVVQLSRPAEITGTTEIPKLKFDLK
jgi:undecaprenyl-diphosphatase